MADLQKSIFMVSLAHYGISISSSSICLGDVWLDIVLLPDG